jgi:hypothetical protein
MRAPLCPESRPAIVRPGLFTMRSGCCTCVALCPDGFWRGVNVLSRGNVASAHRDCISMKDRYAGIGEFYEGPFETRPPARADDTPVIGCRGVALSEPLPAGQDRRTRNGSALPQRGGELSPGPRSHRWSRGPDRAVGRTARPQRVAHRLLRLRADRIVGGFLHQERACLPRRGQFGLR